jgi:hypothetical protein
MKLRSPWFSSVRGLVAAVLTIVSFHASAQAVEVEYELIDLGTPGRYEYRYTFTNLSSTTPVNWFSVDFDTSLYDESSLSVSSIGLGDWSEQFLSSVLGTPAQYDAYRTTGSALGIGESQAGFSVQFTWLGGSAGPGSQAFTVYDAGTLDILYTDVTTASVVQPPMPVPEPSTYALVLVGLFAVWSTTRRRPTQSTNLDTHD